MDTQPGGRVMSMSHEFRVDGDRVELLIDGEVVSYVDMEDRVGARAIVHTITTPGYEGQGLAGELVGHVLDELRAQGLGVVPVCPYVRHFLDKNPDYADLVPADRRAEHGL